jgi:hypothetical protein
MYIINFRYTLVSIRDTERERAKKNFGIGNDWGDFTT